MNGVMTVAAVQLHRLVRRQWIAVALLGGVLIAAAIAAVATGDEGLAREDQLRQGAATLLLLGGLAVAMLLGGAALNRDSDSGHIGLLMGAGASRAAVVAGTLVARTVVLAVIVVVWGAALQVGSAAIGLGFDGELAAHTALVGVALLMTLSAAGAASSVVGVAASALFGAVVYLTAQAMVNLKAAADQDIIGTAREGIAGAYFITPHVPTSQMIADLQMRDAAGPAIPRLDINGNEVLLQASGWQTVVTAIVWVAILGGLAYMGMRRRPIA